MSADQERPPDLDAEDVAILNKVAQRREPRGEEYYRRIARMSRDAAKLFEKEFEELAERKARRIAEREALRRRSGEGSEG